MDYGPDDSGEEMETAEAPNGLGQSDSRVRRSDAALTTEALPDGAPEAATEFPLDPELLPGGPGDASDVAAGKASSSYNRMPLDWRNEVQMRGDDMGGNTTRMSARPYSLVRVAVRVRGALERRRAA